VSEFGALPIQGQPPNYALIRVTVSQAVSVDCRFLELDSQSFPVCTGVTRIVTQVRFSRLETGFIEVRLTAIWRSEMAFHR
jgi:hypothetical protein